jgi:hypothetical protein
MTTTTFLSTNTSIPYFGNSYWQISFEPEANCAVIDWLDYNPSNEFRAASEKLLELVIERNLEKVLNNTEQLKIIGTEEQQWVTNDFIPRLRQHGVKVLAMVNSLHYFARLGASIVLSSVDPTTLNVEYFSSKEKALEWLISIPSPLPTTS